MQLSNLLTIFVVISLIFFGCEKQEETKQCEFMYKLEASTLNTGIDSETCMLLGSLQNISSLTPPVAVADIRLQLESGQISPFSDAGFDNFLTRIYSLNLDYSVLTAAELSILNTIREYLQPLPNFSCCGSALLPTVAADFTIVFSPRVGSATFEHSITLTLDSEFTCDIFDIGMSIAVSAGPNPLVFNPVLDSIGCVGGKQTFLYLWDGFVADPTGVGIYGCTCAFRDSGAAVLSSVLKNVSL